MQRHVRGIIFVDYVRMIRSLREFDWSRYLAPEDHAYLTDPIDPEGWYPMETFERFGIGIRREVAKDQLDAVRMWGRFQVEVLRKPYPALVAKGDPRDTLMRFQLLRKSFFDYDALDVLSVTDVDATVAVAYQMSAEAEEAATYQTLGFLEGLVEAAGGKSVQVRIGARAWEGAPRSRIEVHWRSS